jgi:hypothetical protein
MCLVSGGRSGQVREPQDAIHTEWRRVDLEPEKRLQQSGVD